MVIFPGPLFPVMQNVSGVHCTKYRKKSRGEKDLEEKSGDLTKNYYFHELYYLLKKIYQTICLKEEKK